MKKGWESAAREAHRGRGAASTTGTAVIHSVGDRVQLELGMGMSWGHSKLLTQMTQICLHRLDSPCSSALRNWMEEMDIHEYLHTQLLLGRGSSPWLASAHGSVLGGLKKLVHCASFEFSRSSLHRFTAPRPRAWPSGLFGLSCFTVLPSRWSAQTV